MPTQPNQPSHKPPTWATLTPQQQQQLRHQLSQLIRQQLLAQPPQPPAPPATPTKEVGHE